MTDAVDRLKSALADRYSIERELGAGGMARVYLAEDQKLHRKVALKVLRPELAAALGPDRFLQEIDIAAKLTHPHILALHDCGAADGFLYYTMPYVEGESLRDRLNREKQLPIVDALKIAGEVAEALGAAHDHNVIHRDIKPENILLEGGHAVVADFGIARAITRLGRDRLTETGIAVGTPAYLSPEQGAGDSELDGRSDLYSLGCVMYEMLAGEPPFSGSTVENIIRKHISADPTPLTVLRPSVPDDVANTVSRSLEKAPADRFATAAEMAEAVTGAWTAMSRVQAVNRAARVPRRKRVAGAAIVVGLAVVLVVGLKVLLGGGSSDMPFKNLVVVAPFENRTDDRSLDVMGDIAADWISAGLTDLPGVQVLPTQDALQMLAASGGDARESESDLSPSALGSATGASLVIVGSYYRRGANLEFRSQVVDVLAQGTVLFSTEPASGPSDDPVEALKTLGEQLAGSVASHLNVVESWGGQAFVDPRRPPTIDAYRAYAAGSTAIRDYDFERAVQQLNRAIELDSTFIAAYAVLVTAAHYNLGQWAAMDSVYQRASRAVESLTELERAQLGYMRAMVSQDKPAMRIALEAILAVAPSGNMLFQGAYDAVLANRPRAAVEFMERSTEWGGWSPHWGFLTAAQHMLGQHERELQEARRAREQFPNSNVIKYYEARAFVALGELQQLDSLLDEMVSTGAGPNLVLRLAEELDAHGHSEAASRVDRRLLDWYELHLDEAWERLPGRVWRAITLARVGRLDEVQAIVQQLVADHPEHIGFLGYQGVVAARMGDFERAAAISRELAALEGPYLFGNHFAWRARIAAVLGEREQAVVFLAAGLAEGLSFHPSDWRAGFDEATWGLEPNVWLHAEPEFASLRDYPPFQELIRPKG